MDHTPIHNKKEILRHPIDRTATELRSEPVEFSEDDGRCRRRRDPGRWPRNILSVDPGIHVAMWRHQRKGV